MTIQEATQKLIDNLSANNSEILLHISNNKDLKPDCDYSRSRFGKPLGFWYSVGGSWMEWCLEECPHWVRPYIYEVTILDSKSIKSICNVEEFDKFDSEYALPQKHPCRFTDHIDWDKLKNEFSGIQISPYLWKRRLESVWYYGWDCASGCVWDFSSIRLHLFAVYDNQRGFVRV